MNILVIGNGFDLAHGLPTRYTDFLEFVKTMRQLFDERGYNFVSIIDEAEISEQIKVFLRKQIHMKDVPYLDEWKDWLANNV